MASTKKRSVAKSASISDFLFKSLRDQVFYATLTDDMLRDLVAKMFRVEIKAGVSVIRQGDDGDLFYVVESGSFDVLAGKTSPSGAVCDQELIDSRTRGGSFGELALLYDKKRMASVQATADSVLWAVDRDSYKAMWVKFRQEQMQNMKQSCRSSRRRGFVL